MNDPTPEEILATIRHIMRRWRSRRLTHVEALFLITIVLPPVQKTKTR